MSYRPLAAGVLLALLERYMRADRGDEGSVGPTALNPFYSGLEQRDARNCTASGSAMAPLAVLWCVSAACPTPNSPRAAGVNRPPRAGSGVFTPMRHRALSSEPAPPTPPKEREKRDSLLCDGDTVDAVLGSVFD